MTTPEPTEAVAWLWHNRKFGTRLETGPLTDAYLRYPGWTQEPLYTAAALQAERDKERDEVVAWLRQEAKAWHPSWLTDNYNRAADALATNQHRTDHV